MRVDIEELERLINQSAEDDRNVVQQIQTVDAIRATSGIENVDEVFEVLVRDILLPCMKEIARESRFAEITGQKVNDPIDWMAVALFVGFEIGRKIGAQEAVVE